MAEFGERVKQKIERKLLEREVEKAAGIGKEIIRKKKEGKEPTEKEIKEKIKQEVMEYLKSLEEDFKGGTYFLFEKSARDEAEGRLDENRRDKIKTLIAKQDATLKLIQSAIEQLNGGVFGKEIFEVISLYPTSQETLAERNIGSLKKIFERMSKNKPVPSTEKEIKKENIKKKNFEKQIESDNEQIEFGKKRREEWKKQLKVWEIEAWKKNNE